MLVADLSAPERRLSASVVSSPFYGSYLSKATDMITRGALGHRFVLVLMYHGIERLSPVRKSLLLTTEVKFGESEQVHVEVPACLGGALA